LKKTHSFADLIGYGLVMFWSFLLGVIIIGQFTTASPVLEIFGFLCAIIMLSSAETWGPINLLLCRRLILFVGLATLISVYAVGILTIGELTGVDAHVYFLAGIQTAPVYISMVGALLATLFLHKRFKIWTTPKIKAYVAMNGTYLRVIGPPELIDSLKGVGGYIVIGDELQIVGGLYYSGSNSLTDWSINGFIVKEMYLAEINEEDKKLLGI
jgi:hypothetical protein